MFKIQKSDNRVKETTLSVEQLAAVQTLYRYGITTREISNFFSVGIHIIQFQYRIYKKSGIIPDKQLQIIDILRNYNYIEKTDQVNENGRFEIQEKFKNSFDHQKKNILLKIFKHKISIAHTSEFFNICDKKVGYHFRNFKALGYVQDLAWDIVTILFVENFIAYDELSPGVNINFTLVNKVLNPENESSVRLSIVQRMRDYLNLSTVPNNHLVI